MRRTNSGIAACTAFCLLAASVFGDGVGWKGRDRSQLRPAGEREQLAAIHHRNGIERMVISVNFGSIPVAVLSVSTLPTLPDLARSKYFCWVISSDG